LSLDSPVLSFVVRPLPLVLVSEQWALFEEPPLLRVRVPGLVDWQIQWGKDCWAHYYQQYAEEDRIRMDDIKAMSEARRREEEARRKDAREQRLRNLSEVELRQAWRHEFDVAILRALNEEYARRRKYESDLLASVKKEELGDWYFREVEKSKGKFRELPDDQFVDMIRRVVCTRELKELTPEQQALAQEVRQEKLRRSDITIVPFCVVDPQLDC
jgi:hypothetical protein